MTVSPELRKALLAEIEKALPVLLKRAETAVARPRQKVEVQKRRRFGAGAGQNAVRKAIDAYEDVGASREQVRRLASEYLKGPLLNDNTVKRWIVLLHKADHIEIRNGRWYPARSPAEPRDRTRKLQVDELGMPVNRED